MAKVVIIGAGLTGISTAYHLEKNGFTDYKLFEKDTTVGGLCRSVTQDNFTFDYTGHLLHTSDPYFQKLIADVVGLENMNAIDRRSFIYSHGVYTKYPFQSNLYGLPTNVITDCIEGFARRPTKKNKKVVSFHDWVLAHFGAGIARHFFFPFQKKILSYNIRNVTNTWMGRFVPDTTLTKLIEGSIIDRPASVGYNAHFVYPKTGGIEFWIKKLADQLKNEIYIQHQASGVDLKEKKVVFTNGHAESFDILINTMPLDKLLTQLTGSPVVRSLAKAADKLLCNSVINFNLGIGRENLSAKHWIYFPETQFPFYRIGFPHNFTKNAAPAGCSSLYGELSYLRKPKMPLTQMLDHALASTKKLLSFDESEIVTKKIIHIDHAYVIYDFWRETNLPKILGRLEDLNIHSIGRYGAWKYSSMQEAVLDGKNIADRLTISL
ncbi:MAG TPA: FAD-dependent oxidoreductase [Candidatus Babeliales bacterium]|nr:FAD-dependent oxidoreductase [Candidatus Babeliales bacterium]